MLTINIPGRQTLQIQHLVLDFNGTLALDGLLLEGVKPRLKSLATLLRVHVISADTFGSVRKAMEGTPCTVKIIPAREQNVAKADYVTSLNPEEVVAIGNGYNDSLMLQRSILGMGVIQAEGASAETLNSADIIGTDIRDLLDLLLNPQRLKATLRN